MRTVDNNFTFARKRKRQCFLEKESASKIQELIMAFCIHCYCQFLETAELHGEMLIQLAKSLNTMPDSYNLQDRMRKLPFFALMQLVRDSLGPRKCGSIFQS